MKTPIEPSDIRKGDLIRVEFDNVDKTLGPWSEGLTSLEFRSDRNNSGYLGKHYLLDRPAPAVELPTEPTLGWLGVSVTAFDRAPASVLSIWRDRKHYIDGGGVGTWSHEFVTAFTPATAVPTEALDALRRRAAQQGPGSPSVAFLAVVDKAAQR